MNTYKQLLTNTLFVKFFVAINFMTLSQAFVNISIIWLIYDETKNPLLVASFGLLMQISPLIFAPIIAKMLDRFMIHQAMALLLLLRAMIFFTIFMIPLNHNMMLHIMAFLLCVNSAISPALSSGTNIMIAQIVDNNYLTTANALLTIFFDVSYIFSSISVAILAILNNNKLAFLISSILLGLAALIISKMRVGDTLLHQPRKTNYSQSVAIKYILTHKNLFIITTLTIVWNMFTWGVFATLLPVYIENNLENNHIAYGVLNAIQSIGIIIASFMIGTNVFKKLSMEKLIGYGMMLHCLFLIGFHFSHHLILSIILLLIAGICSAPVVIYKSTYYQTMIPREIMGQVLSFILISSSLMYAFGSGIVALILNVIGKSYFSTIHIILLIAIMMMTSLGFKLMKKSIN